MYRLSYKFLCTSNVMYSKCKYITSNIILNKKCSLSTKYIYLFLPSTKKMMGCSDFSLKLGSWRMASNWCTTPSKLPSQLFMDGRSNGSWTIKGSLTKNFLTQAFFMNQLSNRGPFKFLWKFAERFKSKGWSQMSTTPTIIGKF